MTTNILILATGVRATRLQSWFVGAGSQVVVVAAMADALHRLANECVHGVVADVSHIGDGLPTLSNQCQASSVDLVLAVPEVPQAVHYECAMDVGAAAVVGGALFFSLRLQWNAEFVMLARRVPLMVWPLSSLSPLSFSFIVCLEIIT